MTSKAMFKLAKVVKGRPKRLGQGIGSGKGGHTSGRGQKGQKSRGKIGILFEGMKVKKSLMKRLPFARGRSKFKARLKPIAVSTKSLNIFENGAKVDGLTLVKMGLVSKHDMEKFGAKVVTGGKLEKKLEIGVPISVSAKALVEKAGGKIL